MGERMERQLQIILVEKELKQAIMEFIGKRMNVADGMDMDIELSATRGAEGFKAVIDIVPTKPAARPATAPVVTAAAPETEKPAEAGDTHVENTTQEAPFDGGTEAASPSAPGDDHIETTAATHAEAAPAAATGARSLFKGLNKPKNA